MWAVFVTAAHVFTGCDFNHQPPEGEPEPGEPDPIVEPTATPIPPMNPICSGVMGEDGPGNFLWKPKGDHSGTLVVLFPASFVVPFSSVTVARKTGTTEQLSFTGFSNGDRQTWRGSQPGGKYKNNGVINADNCIWQFSGKASQRQD